MKYVVHKTANINGTYLGSGRIILSAIKKYGAKYDIST